MSLKEIRDQAAGKAITTAAAAASDPVGTARGLAKSGAKTALRLPVRAGLAATGPAINVVSRGLAIAGSALRTGRLMRDRVLPGRGDNGWAGPADVTAPVAVEEEEPPGDVAVEITIEIEPEAAPTPETDVPEAAVLAGAPGTADEAVARAERAVGNAVDGATLSHDELPVDDYDHLTLPALRARLTRIDLTGLVQLRDYEKAHANRLPVVTMLDNRIAKVTASNGG
jgi:hypothetical protein